jgi:hypothetical protein
VSASEVLAQNERKNEAGKRALRELHCRWQQTTQINCIRGYVTPTQPDAAHCSALRSWMLSFEIVDSRYHISRPSARDAAEKINRDGWFLGVPMVRRKLVVFYVPLWNPASAKHNCRVHEFKPNTPLEILDRIRAKLRHALTLKKEQTTK